MDRVRADQVEVLAAALVSGVTSVVTQIFGQHSIYQLDPTARARLNSAYLATFFVGGAVGSQLGSLAYHTAGWSGLALFGAALPLLALLGRGTERRPRGRDLHKIKDEVVLD